MTTRWSLLLLAGLTGCAMQFRGHAHAPRPIVVVDPGPRLVVVVGTDLRYCDECDDDVFFYSDFWYAYRSGGWYRCSSWGAPWVVVEMGRLPAVFIEVPPARFKHRHGPRHPAHDHHPGRDHWASDATSGHGDGDRRESGTSLGGAPGRSRGDDPAPVIAREDVVVRDRGDERRPDVREGDRKDKGSKQEKRKEKVKEKKDKKTDKDKEHARVKKPGAGSRGY